MTFALQPEPQLVRECAIRYDSASDQPALEAGKRIQAGDFAFANMATIFKWKTNDRGKSRLQLNSEAEVQDALRLACQARTERSALAVLTGLHGVAVPVASAILTAIFPERFTIIDFRALEALGQKNWDESIDYYIEYLKFCRDLASSLGMSLRQLDRGLWQWSSERANKD